MKSAPLNPRLITGSSAQAPSLCSDLVQKITLVVTSPPYHNAISYDAHQEDPTSNYRPRQGVDYASEYLPLLNSVWSAARVMLRPGGFLAINVGTVLDSGNHIPLPQDIIASLTRSPGDWEYIRSIIWFKVTAGVKRAGSVIQHKMPGYWYPNIMTEHIIIMRKPGPQLEMNRDRTPEEWWEHVWDLAPVPPRTIDHPAPFPEDLPHRLIRMLTQPDDWVMDPFNGSGSTTKAAFDLRRHSVGFDIASAYNEIAASRIDQSSLVRTSQLRITPVRATEFTPKKMKGTTRHGAGLSARKQPR